MAIEWLSHPQVPSKLRVNRCGIFPRYFGPTEGRTRPNIPISLKYHSTCLIVILVSFMYHWDRGIFARVPLSPGSFGRPNLLPLDEVATDRCGLDLRRVPQDRSQRIRRGGIVVELDGGGLLIMISMVVAPFSCMIIDAQVARREVTSKTLVILSTFAAFDGVAVPAHVFHLK